MSSVKSFRLLLPLWLSLALAGCASRKLGVVQTAPPWDRYDHNRTCQLLLEAGETMETLQVDSTYYAPYEESSSPKIRASTGTAADELPAGHLMPVFTGVELPLTDSAKEGCGLSDREDLLGFLSQGPKSHSGTDTRGPLAVPPNTRKNYEAVLSVLSDSSPLRSSAELKTRAAALRLKSSAKILDHRYPTAWFEEALALRAGEYVFIVYRPHGAGAFTRLVVTPFRVERWEGLSLPREVLSNKED